MRTFTHAVADNVDAFLSQPRCLIRRKVLGEVPVGAHHPPPREVVAAGRQERADRAGAAGIAGLVGHPRIGEGVPAWETGDHRPHRLIEVRHEAAA